LQKESSRKRGKKVDMIWDNPPEKRNRTSKWAVVAQKLRENPGRWAKLSESKDRNAHSLAGRLRTTFGDGFEVISQTTGTNEDGVKQAGVWARFTGDRAFGDPQPASIVTGPRDQHDHTPDAVGV